MLHHKNSSPELEYFIQNNMFRIPHSCCCFIHSLITNRKIHEWISSFPRWRTESTPLFSEWIFKSIDSNVVLSFFSEHVVNVPHHLAHHLCIQQWRRPRGSSRVDGYAIVISVWNAFKSRKECNLNQDVLVSNTLVRGILSSRKPRLI